MSMLAELCLNLKAKTTEHLPVRHLDLMKALQVTPTKASGQIAKNLSLNLNKFTLVLESETE